MATRTFVQFIVFCIFFYSSQSTMCFRKPSNPNCCFFKVYLTIQCWSRCNVRKTISVHCIFVNVLKATEYLTPGQYLESKPQRCWRISNVLIDMSGPGRFIYSVVCLATGLWPLPKRVLHRGRSRVFSFNFQYPFSLKASSSCLRLSLCLPVTFIPPFIFPSITYFTRQFLRKMWPSQLVFSLLIFVRYSS
jgi:hypothetical protein